MPLMVPVSLIKNSKYLFIPKNVLMAGIYGAPLQGNFSDALGNRLNDSWSCLVLINFTRDIFKR